MSSSNGQWPPGGNNGWPPAPSDPNAAWPQPPQAQAQGGWPPAPQAQAQAQGAWPPAPQAQPAMGAPAAWPPPPNQGVAAAAPDPGAWAQQQASQAGGWPGAQLGNAMVPFGQQQQGIAVMPGAGAETVLGVALEPGERVIHYHKPSYTGDKIALWVLGVLTLIAVVGVAFIIWAIFYEKTQPKGYFVTNRRIVSVDKRGTPVSIPLYDVTDLEAVRNSGQAYGGGLLGAAIGAVADHMSNKNSKADPKYWKRSIGVLVVTRQGTKVNVPSRKAAELGLFLANTLSAPGAAEQAPSVPVAA